MFSASAYSIFVFPQRFAVAAFGVACCLASSLQAQERDDYKVIEPVPSLHISPDDAPDVVRKKKERERDAQAQIRDVLTGKTVLAEKQTFFDRWYTQYVFAKMTLYTPEALETMQKDREKFFRENLQYASLEAAHTHLVELTFAEMKKIAGDDFHPAVRYNAMLIIGELNQKEMVRVGQNAAPPDPYLPALTYLLDEVENAKQLDAVRVAALLGIVRHAYYEAENQAKPAGAKIPPAVFSRMRTVGLAIVKQRQAPAGRTQEGHDWMRRRAVEMLGWLAAAKPDAELVASFTTLAADAEENRGVRCRAVESLGEASYQPPVAVKSLEAAAAVAKFLADVGKGDIAKLEAWREATEEKKKLFGGNAGNLGVPGIEGGPGSSSKRDLLATDPYEYRVDPIRRRLKHETLVSLIALIGAEDPKRPAANSKGIVTSVKVDAEKKKISEAVTAMVEFSKAMDSKDFDTDSFSARVLEFAGKLTEIGRSAVRAAAPPPAAKAVDPPVAAPAKPADDLPEAPKAPPAAPKAPSDDLPE